MSDDRALVAIKSKYSEESTQKKNGSKQLYLESYGCQMNYSDSEIVASIMAESGYETTHDPLAADLILMNTCAIRDNAEQRIRGRLREFNAIKKKRPALVIGVLGCMAERLKSKLLEEEKSVDLVVGPDAYRDIPNLVEKTDDGSRSVNVLLSRDETYADLNPLRLNSNGITAYISIMRGCDNMCSFCVVPFTRGRERSRDPETIVHEARYLFQEGYREVTLLGQNVDSYRWNLDRDDKVRDPTIDALNFASLLERVAKVHPDLRVRFSTSHPKDMTYDVLDVMSKYENICDHIHLPVQSGSTEVLERMNRGYSREWYSERIGRIREVIPECGISSDIMTGFCGETEEEHEQTLSLMNEVRFDFSYMFAYSERPKTLAERKLEDDVSEEIKQKRLSEVITLQRDYSLECHEQKIGKEFKVLIEGVSKRMDSHMYGKTSQNIVMVFPREDCVAGQYVDVVTEDCTSGTLMGRIVKK